VLSPTKKSLLYAGVITNTKITTLCWCYHQQKNAYFTVTIFSELLASPTQKSLLYVGVITNKKMLMLLLQFSPSCWHHQNKNHYSMLVLSPTKKYLCYYDNFLRVAGITNTKITTLCWCYHQQKNTYVTITIFSELLASPKQKSLG
jgi:hypothetical protein